MPESSTIREALDKLSSQFGPVGPVLDYINCTVPSWAYSQDPKRREEIIIRYTVGTGRFNKDKSLNVLIMEMFEMNGRRDGSHTGVWEPQSPPGDWVEVPPRPKGPLDKPEGAVHKTEPRAYTRAIWKFGQQEKDTITAVGPAMLHFVDFNDKSRIFLVSVAAIITNGEGKFEGARGVKTALGATFVPKGVDFSKLTDEDTFGAVTIETFRVIRKEFIAGAK